MREEYKNRIQGFIWNNQENPGSQGLDDLVNDLLEINKSYLKPESNDLPIVIAIKHDLISKFE